MEKSIVDILFELSFALALTILIEWGLSFFFLHSKTDRQLVILAQCLTNPVLNTLLLINDYFEFLNRTILIIILELCVVTIEAVIYKKGHVSTKIDPFFLSLFLNLASVCTGLLFYQFAN